MAKRQMMLAWCAWLDKWAERAIKEDPRLLGYDWVCEAIYRNRYGEERLQRRILLRKNRAHNCGAWIPNENVQLESGERLNVRMLFVAQYGMVHHSKQNCTTYVIEITR